VLPVLLTHPSSSARFPPVFGSLYPLFPGANELDQINKIHDIMGTPDTALLAKIRK
jgi:hypothetical protein